MSDCIFCKIANKEIPSQIVFENDEIIAFNDLNPQAPHHYLFIPKKHFVSISEVEDQDSELMGKILREMSRFADQKGLSEKGFRIVNNTGADGGQTVFHIHFHLLGGRSMKWPPG